MKKIFSIVNILLLIIMCSGCSSSVKVENKVNNRMSREELMNFPKNITKKLEDNFYINANTNVNYLKNYNILNSSYKKYEEKQLCNIFFGNDKIIDRREENYSRLPKEKDVTISSDSGRFISYGKNYLIYNSKEYDHYASLISGANDFFREDLKDIFHKDTLTSFDKDYAIQKVKDLANELNIKLDEFPTIYSLDKDSLNTLENNFMTDEEYAKWEAIKPGQGKKTWIEDDESYLLIFRSSIDKMPLYAKSSIMGSNNSKFLPSQVQVLVNKSGVIMFKALSVYDNISTNTKNSDCINYLSALDVVKARYNNMIITEPIEISSIELVYLAKEKDNNTDDCLLTPAWVFITQYERKYVDAKGESIDKVIVPIIVDAITGEEINL